jgi:hypothetical protein
MFSRPSKHSEPWSDTDVRRLRALASRYPIRDIAVKLHRTQASVTSKAAQQCIAVSTG